MSKIEWTDKTWNPITGCEKISAGCQNCYAERMSKRLAGRFGYPKEDPFRPGVLHKYILNNPLKWKKPKKIFVSSMGDLFHHKVSIDHTNAVFDVMRKTPHHTYMLLTKRPKNAVSFAKTSGIINEWPRNIWFGITAENQEMYDMRWPIACQIPAPIKFLSYEPALGPINILRHEKSPDWVIYGKETGPGARPAQKKWAVDIKKHCDGFMIPFFYKNGLLNGEKYEVFPETI